MDPDFFNYDDINHEMAEQEVDAFEAMQRSDTTCDCPCGPCKAGDCDDCHEDGGI